MVTLPWTDTSRIENGNPVVSITNKTCVTPKGVTVRETDSTVDITAWGTEHKAPCSAIGYALLGAVPLTRPLGDRKLTGSDS